jgi:hypothetical protein
MIDNPEGIAEGIQPDSAVCNTFGIEEVDSVGMQTGGALSRPPANILSPIRGKQPEGTKDNEH